MNLSEKYHRWAEQWPEASRVALPLWLGCILLAGAAGWGIYSEIKLATPTTPAAEGPAAGAGQTRPAWLDQAGAAARMFPLDPELWQEAARLLAGVDSKAADDLQALSGQVSAESAGTSGSSRPGAPALEPGGGDPLLLDALRSSAAANTDAVPTSAAQSFRAGPEPAAMYAGWLMLRSRWPEALAWINGLPPEVSRSPRIRELRAEALCRLGDWDAIRSALAEGAWGPAKPEAVDLALCGCIAAARGRTDLRRDLWSAALEACGQSPAAARAVLRIALASGLEAESSESFQAVLLLDPDDRETARQFKIWTAFHTHAQPEASAGEP